MEIGQVKRPTDIIIDEALEDNKPRKYKKKSSKRPTKRPAKPVVAIVKKSAPKKKPVPKPAARVVKKKSLKRPAKPVSLTMKKKTPKRPTERPAKPAVAILKKKPTPAARIAQRPRNKKSKNKKPTRTCLAPFAVIAIALIGALLFVYISATKTEEYEVAPVEVIQETKPIAETRRDEKKTEKQENEIEHTVRRGDTLFKISKRYTGSGWGYKSIARYNQIENPNIIEIGQIIKIRLK